MTEKEKKELEDDQEDEKEIVDENFLMIGKFKNNSLYSTYHLGSVTCQPAVINF